MRPSTLALGLIALTLAVFLQTVNFEFIHLDDDLYVTDNSYVQQGLTFEGLRYAFSTEPAPMSNPLALVSHMVDVQLFGVHAGMHHLVNVLFHLANVLLLFAVLLRMTGRAAPSFVVAALFAVHPLHVESVAWVSDRKDLLSAFFWLIALLLYVRRGRNGESSSMSDVAAVYALSLLAKPMAVTFPFVLVLLDLWPLKRLEEPTPRAFVRLVREKWALFVLSFLACIMAWYLQQSGGATQDLRQFSLGERLSNAVASYGIYLKQTILPTNLGLYYPMPEEGPGGTTILLSVMVLLAASVASSVFARRAPWYFVGWWWFVGMLVPVIGLVQVGDQAHADRYMYLPIVGLLVALVFGCATIAERSRAASGFAAAAAALAIGLAGFAAHGQTALWRNSERLLSHTLEVCGPSLLIHNNLGKYYLERNDAARAEEQFLAADALHPGRLTPNYNLAFIAYRRGEYAAAADRLRTLLAKYPSDYDSLLLDVKANLALQQITLAAASAERAYALAPDRLEAAVNLGLVREQQGRLAEAENLLEVATRTHPNEARVLMNFANFLARQGRIDSAMEYYERALALTPRDAALQYNMGAALERAGRSEDAADAYRRALELKPDFTAARDRLNPNR